MTTFYLSLFLLFIYFSSYPMIPSARMLLAQFAQLSGLARENAKLSAPVVSLAAFSRFLFLFPIFLYFYAVALNRIYDKFPDTTGLF